MRSEAGATRPEGVTGSAFPGPFPVGSYAAMLRDELRKRARVQLFGEVFNLSASHARVYFELRDGAGALPCAMWRDAFDRLGLPEGALVDGAQVVVAGGPDYYPGSRTSSPSFSFDVTGLRVAATATCSPSSTRCGGGCTPRGCSSRRSASRARASRSASASSPARAARRAATCWPAWSGAAGAGASCGRSRRSRTGARPRPSRAR